MMEIGIEYIIIGMALHVAEIAGILTILVLRSIEDHDKR